MANMSGPSLRLWMHIALIFSCAETSFCTEITAEGSLYERLVAGRRPVRPARRWEDTVNVGVGFSLIQIRELDGAVQELSMIGMITLQWQDDSLSWDPGDYDNISFTYVPSSAIWIPSFVVRNSVSGNIKDDKWEKQDIQVSANGHVNWSPTGRFLTYCEVDAYYFPFDRQNCRITISNFMSPASYTNFTPLHTIPFTDNHTIFSNEWTFISSSVIDDPILNNGVLRSNIDFVLSLKRVSNYYSMTMILPIAMISCVSLMVFPLPPECGEKMCLSMTCFMSFFITQVAISEHMPTNYRITPVIVVFNIFSMVQSVLSVCVTALVLAMHFTDPNFKVPVWLDRLLLRAKAKEEGKATQVEEHSLEAGSQVDGRKSNSLRYGGGKESELAEVKGDQSLGCNKKMRDNRKWKELSKTLNNLFFCIFTLAYFLMMCVCSILWNQA